MPQSHRRKGVLKTYLLNTYTARKLTCRAPATPFADLQAIPASAAAICISKQANSRLKKFCATFRSGLYVTELLGQGVNMVTGDYSRGASGIWIENGEFTYPVQEVTVAGNLKEIFRNISAIGNDLVFRGSVASPTLRIDGMTIAGE